MREFCFKPEREILVAVFSLLLAVCCSNQEPQRPTETKTKTTELSRMEESGRRIYAGICSYCHGVAGDGFGLNTPNLEVAPRDHTDAAYMGGKTDDELFKVISQGGASIGKSSLMPPWGGRLNEREIRALISYLRVLSAVKSAHGA